MTAPYLLLIWGKEHKLLCLSPVSITRHPSPITWTLPRFLFLLESVSQAKTLSLGLADSEDVLLIKMHHPELPAS